MMQVVWFKRDVRLVDHAPLQQAVAACAATQTPLLCLYMIEPALWQQPDMAGRHWAFLAESLQELAAELSALGQQLYVMRGAATEILSALQQHTKIEGLWSHMETGNNWTYARDRAVAAWARRQRVVWHEVPPFGVARASCLVTQRPTWAKEWARTMRQPMLPAPQTLPPPPEWLTPTPVPTTLPWLAPDPCPRRQPGGRRAGLHLVDSFFRGRGEAYHYRLSSPLTARQACSRWSVHLAYGTLTLREVVQRCEAELAAPDLSVQRRRAYRALLSRLHWHCHFIQKFEDAPRMEHTALHEGLQDLRPARMDAATQQRFAAWAAGQTGWPLVDATMAELRETGWITFRMRALLVSVATVHLWLPWQAVALHLARLFTDYEPGIHYPQVQMQSGATGTNTVRAYNPTKQAYDQDPEGVYVRRWLPALRQVPAAFIHTPWQMEAAQQEACGCVLGRDYPWPLVDEAAARKEGVAQLYRPRQDAAFKEVQAQLLRQHSQRGAVPQHRRQTGRTGAKVAKKPEPLGVLPLFEGR